MVFSVVGGWTGSWFRRDSWSSGLRGLHPFSPVNTICAWGLVCEFSGGLSGSDIVLFLRSFSFLKARVLHNQGDFLLIILGRIWVCVCMCVFIAQFIIQAISEKEKARVDVYLWHDSENLQRSDDNLEIRSGGTICLWPAFHLLFCSKLQIPIHKSSLNSFYIPPGRWISSLCLHTSTDRDPHYNWGSRYTVDWSVRRFWITLKQNLCVCIKNIFIY